MKWENEGLNNGIEESIEEDYMAVAGTEVSHRHEVDGKK